MSIHANEKNNKGYTYLKYTKTTSTTGKVSRTYIEYANLPLLFVPLSRFRKLGDEGQTMRGTSECIVRAKWFEDNGIVPEADDRKLIDKIIYEELVYHTITPESKAVYLEIINKLQAKGAQGVILGCTEIPLLVKQEDSPIPVFDTTTNHALAVLNYALADEEE